jgi:nitroreductase
MREAAVDAIEAIMTRRSVRSFGDEPISDEEAEIILRAAMAAPSATNEQPWHFVVVRDRAVLERLSRSTPYARPLAAAPLGLVVCADKRAVRYPGFWVIDCAAAIENALVAAHAIGLGGVWIGVHPVPPFRAAVRRVVGLPGRMVPHSLVAFGHPQRVPGPADRFDPDRLHTDRW